MANDKLNYKDYSRLDKYLDDQQNQNTSEIKELTSKLDVDKQNTLLEEYSSLRGKLQYIFGDISISHTQIAELIALGEDPGKMALREARKMEQVRKAERSNVIFKVLNIVGLIALLAAGAYFLSISRVNEDEFRPLNYLGWETEAFEYDATGRLDFPIADIEEINGFLGSYRQLGFSPVVITPSRQSLRVKGATVIDYEPRKVAVVIYNDHARSDDILALYSFKGRLKDLPKADKGNSSGLIYQTYTSDKYNIVAWEADEETIGLIVGRMSAQDLAEFAKKHS